MCIFKQAPIHAIRYLLTTQENKFANATCEMTSHKEHYSSMYATALCKIVALFERCVAFNTSQFQGGPSFVRTEQFQKS